MRHIVAWTAIALAAYLFEQGWSFYPWMLVAVVGWEYLLLKPRTALRLWWRSTAEGEDRTTLGRFSRGLTGRK